MANYIELSLEKAQEILSSYAILPQRLIPLTFGISNTNYRVEAKDSPPFLLKISNDKNLSQLKSEQEILLKLEEWGHRLSLTPIKTLNGEATYRSGEYFGVVYPFVSGKVPSITPDSLREIGKALAGLHLSSIGKADAILLRSHTDVGHDLKKIMDYAQNSPTCPMDFRESFEELLLSPAQELFYTTFPQGLIHGDLYYDNTLFDNNHLVSLIDFEQSGIGEFIFDLGVSISGSCLENGDLNPELIDAYIAGYETMRPLEAIEKQFLNEFILIGLFSISLWRIMRFKEGNLDPKKENSYQELLIRAKKFAHQIHYLSF